LRPTQTLTQEGRVARGLSLHAGSQCTNPYACVEPITSCRTIFNQAPSLAIAMDTLDCGGGFPASSLEPVMPVEQFAEPISAALRQYFGRYRLLAEPGRFIVGDAVTLVVQVVGRCVRDEIKWYYIDDGLYGSFSGKLYDHCDYPIAVEKEGRKELCVIAGPTCDSFDVVYQNRALPDLDVGDLILFDGMGAYTNASATHFNGLPQARLAVVWPLPDVGPAGAPGTSGPGPGDTPEGERMSEERIRESTMTDLWNVWFCEQHRNRVGLNVRVKRFVYAGESPFQEINIIDTHEFGRMLVLYGSIMTTEKDEFIYHEMLAHVPLGAHPAPRSVLIIGGGDGGTLREVVKHPQVEQVTLVEIDRMVVETCKQYLPTIATSFDHPK